ncbi:hypothetical protein PUR21_01990 [Methylorubrum rhodesianum]|uniref:Uncharacterized protein n=2 Tax=Methylorubrum rhodesianum TaxID=29427 RepID=A0ABU9Z5B1_9HYPH
MARAVAALPQAEKDFFDGLVADRRAKAAEAERIAKLRAMSDLDAVEFAIKRAADVFALDGVPERLLTALREAGFVRADLKHFRDAHQALELVVRIVVDAAPQLSGAKLASLNSLIMQAAVSLSLVDGSANSDDHPPESLTDRDSLIAEWGSNWRVGLARINFEEAYFTAARSSQPDDWMQAALLGQQLVNALDGRP